MSVLFAMPNWCTPSEAWMQRTLACLGDNVALIACHRVPAPTWGGRVATLGLWHDEPALWRRAAHRLGLPVACWGRKVALRNMAAAIRRPGVDRVLIHYLDFALQFMPVWQESNIPLFVHAHGYDATWDLRRDEPPHARVFPNDYPERVRALARRATIIANSKEMVLRLQQIGVPAHAIALKYFGVPAPVHPPKRSSHGRPLNILYLGRLVDCKGPDLTIQAFDLACQRVLDAHLTIAGGGPLLAACLALQRHSSCPDRIRLLGEVEPTTAQNLMVQADLFTAHHRKGPITGQEEAFGVALAEAQAAGLPVVTGISGGVPEIVADGKTGILFTPGDVDAHARALLRLFRDESLGQKMGQAGWARVHRLFSPQSETITLRQILDLDSSAPSLAGARSCSRVRAIGHAMTLIAQPLRRLRHAGKCALAAMQFRRARRILLGAGPTKIRGWLATDTPTLDITRRADFLRYWNPSTRDTFLAEHVWEHLTPEQALTALANCLEFLRPGGHLRLAVPDGLHPDPAYVAAVIPDGPTAAAHDHQVLYDYRSLSVLLQRAGFAVRLLEYWDEHGVFHQTDWSVRDGLIHRCAKLDSRNQGGRLAYTSLIVDAVKPDTAHEPTAPRAGHQGLPRVTFGMIVLNGEPFTRYNLRALYPFAHQIIVVEGACPAARGVADPRGHSTDGTLDVLRDFQRHEDPEHKVIVVTAEDDGHPDGFWPGEKDQQSRAYAARATGDWLWQVDCDEFYRPQDMQRICDLLTSDPGITAVSFHQLQFWGGFDTVVDGWYLRRGAAQYHRLFRWGPGYHYATHRPPTVVDASGGDLRQGRWLTARDTRKLGIELLHYSLVFPAQVAAKSNYYAHVDWTRLSQAQKWAEEVFLHLNHPYRCHNDYRHFGWLQRYRGQHPAAIEQLRQDIAAGRIGVQMRPTGDLERLVDSPLYHLGIAALKVLDYPVRYWQRRHRNALRFVTRPLEDPRYVLARLRPGGSKRKAA